VASWSPAEPGAQGGAITALLALMLAFGLVGASLADRLRLPRIVGWLLAGLGLK
jgi:Kef-type K+ transport system membrane component KefB